MNTNLKHTSLVLSPQIPPAFLCTQTKQVMSDPVLSLCGHIFERSIATTIQRCPVDQSAMKSEDLIPLKELGDRIVAWKKSLPSSIKQTTTTATSSYHAALSAGPLSFASAARSGASSSSSSNNPQKTNFSTELVKHRFTIKNAHQDDIHGFEKLDESRFISGSKDTTLKIWDYEGNVLKTLNPSRPGYQYWITALEKFDNGQWASGTRDGFITIWDDKGQQVKEIFYNPSANVRNDTKSKDRNKARINCIVQQYADSDMLRFYTGTPKFVQLWDGRSGNLLFYYQAHNNDWVYCIEPLEGNRLIVVIGSEMELWQTEQQQGVTDRSKLIKENMSERSQDQRPHISAIQRIENHDNLLASALFDGSVRIVDLDQQKVIARLEEHKRRVWSVINIRDNIIASSADDKTIKLWDIRQPQSIQTIGNNPGRVSSLLRLTDNQFISGSCPDDVFRSPEKAQISFWDIRKAN